MDSKINFSNQEKELLVQLIQTEEKIISNKRTNKETNRLKELAWERIVLKYNSYQFVYKRNSSQLKRCWEKIKQKQRMEEREAKDAQGLDSLDASEDPLGDDGTPDVNDLVPQVGLEIPNTSDNGDSKPVLTRLRRKCLTRNKAVWTQEALASKFNKRHAVIKILTTIENNLQEDRNEENQLFLLRKEILEIQKQQKLNSLLYEKRKQEKDLEHMEQLHQLQIQKFNLEMESLKNKFTH